MYICRENNLLLLRMKTILLLGTLLLCGTFAASTAQAGNGSDMNDNQIVCQQRRSGSDVDRVVKQRYPGCRILDRDYDDGRLEVKIRHQGREKILIFDGDQRWERTVWELRREQLPKAVVRALAGIGFAFRYLDDNDNMAVDTPLGRFYAVQVDTDRRDGIYVVSEGGRIAFRYTDDGWNDGRLRGDDWEREWKGKWDEKGWNEREWDDSEDHFDEGDDEWDNHRKKQKHRPNRNDDEDEDNGEDRFDEGDDEWDDRR